MPVKIINRISGSVIYRSESAGNIAQAVAEAYRKGADLRGADLSGADLRGADLRGANLRGAKGVSKYITSPLYMLLDQPGKIRAYKLVTSDLTGPHYPGLR